ncbi:MAG TPA: zinc-binding dehydrogenase [Cyclobacteriaceae bacterium]|nr:zinc-binding dehydrogenase [Cyclobacteriaceae bacterium]HRW99543.1 zinc-binding dehydrogenase [Cyclobacteriaceae bacterium]
MKALVLTGPGTIEIKDIPKPEIKSGHALVRMKGVALNRRDDWIREGKYPRIKYGVTLGSDGAGIVESVFDEIHKPWEGQEVVINPNMGWGSDPEVQSHEYTILGMPVDGTFAEYLLVNVDRLHHKPFHLDFLQAATLPLGGLTAYRALFRRGGLKPGQNVLISGFGGGVAQFAFLFAQAAGANVYITSGSDEKIEKALKMGAKGAFNYKKQSNYEDLWKTKGGFDLIVDSAGGDQLNSYIKLLRPHGRIVFYGATNGLPNKVDLYRMFWNQLTLQGTTMGNDSEFNEMLSFVSKHKIRPVVDSIRPFSKIGDSFRDITMPNKVGKIVIQVS